MAEGTFAPVFMNRFLQRQVLLEVAATYGHGDGLRVEEWNTQTPERVQVLLYLEEHGLTDVVWVDVFGGQRQAMLARITARGLDFLADDGGLTAVLGVVTIRLHEDTVRELLLSKVDGAHSISLEERSSLKEAIRKLPSKAIEKLTDKLLETGADRLALEIPTLRTWLGQVVGQLLS